MTYKRTKAETRQAIVRRIRALRTKTVNNGATPEEAQSALKKARLLARDYGITLDELAPAEADKHTGPALSLVGNGQRLIVALIDSVIPEKARRKLNETAVSAVEMAVVKHLFGLTSYKEYTAETKQYLKTPLRVALRNEAMASFPIMFNLKHALVYILREGTPSADMPAVFRKYKIADHSVLIDGMRRDRIYTKARSMAKSALMHFETERAIRDKCGVMVQTAIKQLRPYIRYKFRFIVQPNGMQLADIAGELIYKGVQTFLHAAPLMLNDAKRALNIKDPDLYMLRLLKLSMKNRGLHRISFYTAQKRKRLHNDGHGQFYTTELSFHANNSGVDDAGDNSEAASENSKIYRFMGQQSDQFLQLETSMTIQDLFATHGAHPRKRKTLSLLIGQPDPDFTNFAMRKFPDLVKASHDTQDIFERLGPGRFLKTVRLYIRADKKDFYQFTALVRSSL